MFNPKGIRTINGKSYVNEKNGDIYLVVPPLEICFHQIFSNHES